LAAPLSSRLKPEQDRGSLTTWCRPIASDPDEREPFCFLHL
jgi:hypothetical protein